MEIFKLHLNRIRENRNYSCDFDTIEMHVAYTVKKRRGKENFVRVSCRFFTILKMHSIYLTLLFLFFSLYTYEKFPVHI